MKENRKRWALLLTCGLLCALLLSGCSDMMQALADGTDAVLGGLAEGTDRIAGALADGTDAVLDAAAGATDDSVKDTILDAYGSLMDAAGYEDFSGTELLFGGTTLDREAGNTVDLSCSLDIEEGEAVVFLCSGSDDPVVLLSESGDYASTIEVGGGSTYIACPFKLIDRQAPS